MAFKCARRSEDITSRLPDRVRKRREKILVREEDVSPSMLLLT